MSKFKNKIEIKEQTLGKQLRERRLMLELRQWELAERAGVTRQYMCGLEKDQYTPGVQALIHLSSILQVSFIIDETGIRMSKNKI